MSLPDLVRKPTQVGQVPALPLRHLHQRREHRLPRRLKEPRAVAQHEHVGEVGHAEPLVHADPATGKLGEVQGLDELQRTDASGPNQQTVRDAGDVAQGDLRRRHVLHAGRPSSWIVASATRRLRERTTVSFAARQRTRDPQGSVCAPVP
jgi:hypothetical protein